jgi:hypothetical protein
VSLIEGDSEYNTIPAAVAAEIHTRTESMRMGIHSKIRAPIPASLKYVLSDVLVLSFVVITSIMVGKVLDLQVPSLQACTPIRHLSRSGNIPGSACIEFKSYVKETVDWSGCSSSVNQYKSS